LEALAAVTIRGDDPIEPADESADRLLLAQQVRDRENRWRGAVTDPLLRSQLGGLQDTIDGLERNLREYSDIRASAHEILVANPTRSTDDYRVDAELIRSKLEALVGRIGELKGVHQRLKDDLQKAQEEFRTLRRPVELGPDELTDNLDEAITIRDRLLNVRDNAANTRAARESEQQAAVDAEKIVVGRVELTGSIVQRLGAGLRRLAGGGAIVPTIELAGSVPTADGTSMQTALQPPESLATLFSATRQDRRQDDSSVALQSDKSAVATTLDRVDADVDLLQGTLNTLEKRAGIALDATEALLRDAAEDVVRGDRIIQILRAAPRRALADLALTHHEDIVQRLTAVQHHVASFDARLEALADTAYATVADLLREVRRTVRESQLPNTAALGRWAGAELLQLTGLDTLKVELRRAAVAATLRTWFNPERPEARPRRFDSNDVINELMRAVTPQFAARILIPSDPLDPEHKPVDHLALETSGGEGVTVALILASLLASRRASARGHRRTTLMLDNPFAKVTKPEFLRLARDVANELRVQLVAFTGIRDIGALTVFPRLTQLRVSRRENANFIVPYNIDDDRLQLLVRNGTLFVSPTEWAASNREGEQPTWPLMSAVTVSNRRKADVP
jgi:hypothetical protein